VKFLGVDGGGTHLRATLLENHAEKKFLIKEGVNLTSKPKEQIKNAFSRLFRLTGPVNGMVLSFSGAETQERRFILESVVKEVYRCENLEILTDIKATLLTCYNGEPTVVVIAGTGSVVLGIDAKGNTKRSGGWGHLFDDEGSAYWISLRILQEFFKYNDNLRDYDPIFDRVLNFYQVQRFEDLTNLQSRSDFKERISAFTREIFNTPSSLVSSIIEEGVSILGKRCTLIIKTVGSNRLFVHGGMFNVPQYLEQFKKHLPENIEINKVENIDTAMAYRAKKQFEQQ